MKLLVVSPMPPSPTAEADYALQLCQRLVAAGVEVDVATTAGSRGLRFDGFRVHAATSTDRIPEARDIDPGQGQMRMEACWTAPLDRVAGT